MFGFKHLGLQHISFFIFFFFPEYYLIVSSVSGHNIFGEDIVKTLTGTADVKERSKFILMDKIQPPVAKNYIVRAELSQPVLADVVSEIGFFGILIR